VQPARFLSGLGLALLALWAPVGAQAPPILNDYGNVGLIELPSARTLPEGHAAVGAARIPPYRHGFFTLAPLPRLEATLRYTDDDTRGAGGEEVNLLTGDLKLLLNRESAWLPQLALGARSLAGDRRFSGEYLVASKRFGLFDLTLGVGWGRFAGRGTLPNPLRLVDDYFALERDFTGGTDRTRLREAFTGRRIGLFGGLSVQLPVPGLRALIEVTPDDFAPERARDPDLSVGVPVNVGAEWRALIEVTPDDFAPERARDPDLSVGVPVNVGAEWRPLPGLAIGAAVEQGSRLMARVSLSGNPGALPTRPAPSPPPAIRSREDAAPADTPSALRAALLGAGVAVNAVALGGQRAEAWIDVPPGEPAARAIGRTARHLTALAPPQARAFAITVGDRGLPSATVTLARGDLERAGRHAGSAEEIWHDAVITPPQPPARRTAGLAPRFEIWGELRNELSLFDREQARLARISLLGDATVQPLPGLVFGAGARVNVADNLVAADPARDISDPVRSDRARFADAAPVRLERLYAAWLWSPRSLLQARIAAGYVEEAYAAAETEVLWRPDLRSRWAVSARSAVAWRREADSQFGLTGRTTLTGDVAVHYRMPLDGVDVRLSAGRRLAGDFGVRAEAARLFDNGIRIAAFGSAGEKVTGTDSRFSGGLTVSVPLQRLVPFAPRSRATARLAPLLRDAGQRLEAPLRLETVTRRTGFAEIARTWPRLLD
jgi:hypothetical protein